MSSGICRLPRPGFLPAYDFNSRRPQGPKVGHLSGGAPRSKPVGGSSPLPEVARTCAVGAGRRFPRGAVTRGCSLRSSLTSPASVPAACRDAENQVRGERPVPRTATTTPGAEERRRWGQPGGSWGPSGWVFRQDRTRGADGVLGRDSETRRGPRSGSRASPGFPGAPAAGPARSLWLPFQQKG